jgi:RimJ/RimL family protein N-acetyltransferase
MKTDLPLILAWSNSEIAFGPYLTPERYEAESLKELFLGNAFWNRNDKTFLIEKRRSEKPIGTIHYWLRQGHKDKAVISVKVAVPDDRGKGYGTEAQKFLIIHLFDQVGINIVEMYTDIDNTPQQRCLNKLGFSICASLTYDDRQVTRTGHLFQLTEATFREKAIYRFHYE